MHSSGRTRSPSGKEKTRRESDREGIANPYNVLLRAAEKTHTQVPRALRSQRVPVVKKVAQTSKNRNFWYSHRRPTVAVQQLISSHRAVKASFLFFEGAVKASYRAVPMRLYTGGGDEQAKQSASSRVRRRMETTRKGRARERVILVAWETMEDPETRNAPRFGFYLAITPNNARWVRSAVVCRPVPCTARRGIAWFSFQ